MTDIDKMMTERGTRYGEFESHAMVTQQLKNVMQAHPNWKSLDEHHKEALDMIQHKIGRILNGDPTYRDPWDDIAGYARLVPPIDEKRSRDDTEIHEEDVTVIPCPWCQCRDIVSGCKCPNCDMFLP